MPSAGLSRMAGMPASLPAALDDGQNQFAILVAEGHLRAQQVGSAQVAAAEVRAVATRAADAIQRFAARDLGRVAGRPLLAGNQSTRAAPSCSASALRRCFLRREASRHGKRQSEQSCGYLDPHPSPLRQIPNRVRCIPTEPNFCIVRLFREAAHLAYAPWGQTGAGSHYEGKPHLWGMKIGARVAVNPVTDGAGSGFRKDGGTHASLVCHRGRLAFSRESPGLRRSSRGDNCETMLAIGAGRLIWA